MPPHITKEAIEAALINGGTKVTVAGGGIGGVFGFLHQNFVAIAGIAIAALGYFTSLYFQKRRDEREHRMAQLESKREELEQRLLERQLEKLRTSPAPLGPIGEEPS